MSGTDDIFDIGSGADRVYPHSLRTKERRIGEGAPPMTRDQCPSTAPTTNSIEAAQHLRLELKPVAPIAPDVDGAWWPRSKNLATELPTLLTALSERLGTVALVGYHLNAWDNAADQIDLETGTVILQGFTSENPHTVIVIGDSGQCLTLGVVPPQTANATALQALKDASRLDAGSGYCPDSEGDTAIDRSLDAVAARLARIAGTTDEKRIAIIAHWVDQAAEQFVHAPIQTFVPMLVEHIVRQKLFPHDPNVRSPESTPAGCE